jgi:hypothetical protein
MSIAVTADWDKNGIAGLDTGPLKAALKRALRKAGATALRDMRAEASKRIRERKRIRGRYITRALTMRRPKGGDIAGMEWAIDVSGEPVPLVAYPHRVVGKRGDIIRGAGGRFASGSGAASRSRNGVSVEVNRGKRTLLKGAFVASMRSGHEGVFRREGKARLPIEELRGSRPVDALLHEGESEAVAARGGRSFAATLERLLPIEIEKGK